MRRLSGACVVLFALTMALAADVGRAQSTLTTNEPGDIVRYGADYFAANLDPRLKSWLALVEKGHVNQRVWTSFFAGQYGAALDDTKYALERFPNHPRALFLLGEIGKATGDLSTPMTYYEQALKQYPQNAFTHAQYGQFLVDVGAAGAGAAELKEALRLDPSLTSARAWLFKVEPVEARSPLGRDSTATGEARSGRR